MSVSALISMALVDDHPFMLEGTASVLNRHGGFKIVAVSALKTDIATIATRDKPDIIVLSLDGADDTFLTIGSLNKLHAGIKIVAFTSISQAEVAVRALHSGANGYILKSSSSAEFIDAIIAVKRGETYLPPCLTTKVISQLRASSLQISEPIRFSAREEQVVHLLLLGQTNREIARAIQISERTVKHYITILLQKLNVRNRVEFVIAAQRLVAPAQLGSVLGHRAIHIH